MSDPATGTTQVAVLDLDGEGLPDLVALEETLLTLRYWEEPDDDEEDVEPVTDLPAPLAGGYAARAFGRVAPLLLDTQGDRAKRAGRTGTIYSPATGTGSAPAGQLVERAPLRVLQLDAGDVAILQALADALETRPAHEAIPEAAEQHFDATAPGLDGHARTPHEQLVNAARGLADLLTTPARFTTEQAALVAMVADQPAGADVTLDAAQHRVYRELVVALTQAGVGLHASGLAGFIALGE